MRIIAGKWAGTALHSPSGRVRPTGEALRDLWMALLEADLAEARVLDLFAGSGALGLEALSRGARSCDFVENGPSALHALKANVATVRTRRTRIFKRDAIQFIQRVDAAAYDVALADPPYRSRKLERTVRDWMARPFSRVLAIEHPRDVRLPWPGTHGRIDDSVVTVFRRRSTPRPGPPKG